MTMTTVSMVHEYVHQRTGQQQQVRQCADDVSQVFSQKEIACNCTNHDQTDCVAGTPKPRDRKSVV